MFCTRITTNLSPPHDDDDDDDDDNNNNNNNNKSRNSKAYSAVGPVITIKFQQNVKNL